MPLYNQQPKIRLFRPSGREDSPRRRTPRFCLHHRGSLGDAMARPLRLDFAGAVWHLTSRGNAGADIFYCDEDRLDFLELLAEAKRRFNWLIFTCGLLTNPCHLGMQMPQTTLS